MRDSDWSRQFLLRSDWLGLIVASITTAVINGPHSRTHAMDIGTRTSKA